MGKKEYSIDELRNVDFKQFINIYKTTPYVDYGDDGSYQWKFYYSQVFCDLSADEQLELFEIYLIKYFEYIYNNDIRTVSAHTGNNSIGLGLYFSEISATIAPATDIVLTMEFYEPMLAEERRQVSEFSLWVDDPPGGDGNRAEVGFSWYLMSTMRGEFYAADMSIKVLDIVKRVYEKLSANKELCAWYILNGIDLKKLLLQDGAVYADLKSFDDGVNDDDY